MPGADAESLPRVPLAHPLQVRRRVRRRGRADRQVDAVRQLHLLHRLRIATLQLGAHDEEHPQDLPLRLQV